MRYAIDCNFEPHIIQTKAYMFWFWINVITVKSQVLVPCSHGYLDGMVEGVEVRALVQVSL